jgi:hypothetical protein
LKHPVYHTDSEEEHELALKMHTPEERGPRNHVDYMKADQAQITARREENCYASRKVGVDPRFRSLFHNDWYNSVYLHKKKLAVKSYWVSWDYMKGKKSPYLD